MMSQSIAVLPPRPVSPATSVASSMYQSAVSTSPVTSSLRGSSSPQTESPPTVELPPGIRTLNREAPLQVAPPPHIASIPEVDDEVIVSFGADPVSVRLFTPAPVSTPAPAPAPGRPSSSRPSEGSKASHRRTSSARAADDKLRVNVDVGLVALALNARHVRSILDIADVWALHSPPPVRPTSSDSATTAGPSAVPALDVQFRLRGIVLLLLPPTSTPSLEYVNDVSDFFARPLVPPKMPHGYVRAHLEELVVAATVLPASVERTESARVQGRKRTTKARGESNVNLSVNFTLTELSVFSLLLQPNHDSPSSPAELYAYPILITDPNLRSQYPRDHSNTPSPDVHNTLMPTFEVIDWTDPTRRSTSAKLSIWRSRAVQHPLPRQDSAGPRSPPRAQPGMPSSVSPPTPRAMPRFLSTSPGQVGIGRPSLGSGGVPLRPPGPAVVAKFRSHSARREEGQEVEVSFEPLHVFLDLGLLLGRGPGREESATMAFLREVATPSKSVFAQTCGSSVPSDSADSDMEDDADTPPATPRAGMEFGMRSPEQQQEERRRLEQLVLDDLDLGYDYRQKPKSEDPAAERVKDWRKVRILHVEI